MKTGIPSWWQDAVEFLLKDELLGPIVAAYPGESLSGKGDVFSTLVRSIVGQQISVLAADAVWGRLVELVGIIQPDSILEHTPEELAGCGLSRPRARYIHELALAEREVMLHDWDALTDEELHRHFIAFRGIGPWTSEMILIFALMRPDVFSIGDIGLIKAVQLLDSSADTKEKVLAVSKRWSPYRTAACWYLWRMLDPVPVEY
ncbi:MAG: DNA-3-methyladenine glycosylase [Euryarchaeota archaeon]|nr:DNA-3-methyladenine glycosylase [Euryarchaeota archaeon]